MRIQRRNFFWILLFGFAFLFISSVNIYAEDEGVVEPDEPTVQEEETPVDSEVVEALDQGFTDTVETFNEKPDDGRHAVWTSLEEAAGNRFDIGVFHFYDISDPDNIVQMYENTVYQDTSWNRDGFYGIYEKLSWSKPIRLPGYAFDYYYTYEDNPIYHWGYVTDEYGKHQLHNYNMYYFKNIGDYELYTADVENDRYVNSDTYYVYDIVHPDGYVTYSGRFNFDGESIWCIEPQIATNGGIMYTARVVDENLLATFASIFGYTYKGDMSHIARLATQTGIWNAVGYGNIQDTLHVKFAKYNGGGIVELDEEQSQQLAEIRQRIFDAYETYLAKQVLDFEVVSNNAVIQDGTVRLLSEDLKQTVVLRTSNHKLLGYYVDGSMEFPEGVEATMDVEHGTVTLHIDFALYQNGAMRFTMIPKEWQRETVLYTAASVKQKLMKFGVLHPFEEAFTFELPKPTVEIPEEPDEPEKPEEPEEPKEEQPKEPEQEKPEEPKQEEPEESKEETPQRRDGVQTATSTSIGLYMILFVGSCFIAIQSKKKMN